MSVHACMHAHMCAHMRVYVCMQSLLLNVPSICFLYEILSVVNCVSLFFVLTFYC